MATVSETYSVKMVTRLNYGLVNGKEVIKNKTYNDISPDATIAAMHTVATAITGLQVPAMEEMFRIQQDAIFDDGL
ncbi:DUF1659 domain-containing protein [Acetobacterium wieringae]|uniref:DUF1659 domain-containing protein n=1 Tax=Acetobacterium wieringae TaxID=52694 RepID=A0ABY6HJQ3_9FIRM|nr:MULTISPECIES: DUF1659 domain-containing protein [Acetobacterium]HAZ06915.1 hypothetical protein [Acetobacterium sp.]OXS24961.1 MAG: hypothetical protein BI182_15920 [Acetobacterium sp. MES1]URN85638.1 DUF1659 domain-containing protein [Acetobacterium wieringae]UYO64104.1 DUF1659 domain-containing protein [Acetobacterium wieringae]VUZ25634.1 Uncharacterised protein [Acetobacterium wieringae]